MFWIFFGAAYVAAVIWLIYELTHAYEVPDDWDI